MDITFITMHDLTPDANVLYASDSIGDVLGHQPRDVIGKSCFEYFHPDETPFAKTAHVRGVNLDRAAMLSYCNLKRTDGGYVRCECVFTVVYSVIVACTSLYQYNEKSAERAAIAPTIRRTFSTSENDPRYHMLTHLSSKFTTPYPGELEPRAALILNRFTRTLSIMYATHPLGDILGIPAEEALGRSFYECIEEDCLQDCVDALERAKANDSIAYLRFRWRDPRSARAPSAEADAEDDDDDEDEDEEEESDDNDENVDADTPAATAGNGNGNGNRNGGPVSRSGSSRSPSGDAPSRRAATTPGSSVSDGAGAPRVIEVEAVVSCTSDGLVVIVRKARGPLPLAAPVAAAPWARAPIVPEHDFMESIRKMAVFAWSLRSINGDIMQHALPGRPLPDSSETVGDYVKPGTTHWKREREWEETLEKEEEERAGKRRAM